MPIAVHGAIHKLAGNDPVTEKLTNGIYTVKATPFGQFFLVKQGEKFDLPEKLYGKFTDIQYWLNYARSTKTNTGILLSGYKGTGKTIEAKKFCNEYNRPVIIIDRNFGENNTELAAFLAAPEFENCVIFIDEFEKLFPNQSSEFLLGLLDGTYETKLTFLFTVNKDKISEYLVNRLGRIRYIKRYESLEEAVVKEVIDDMLHQKKHAASILTLFHIIGVCTFDLLVNVIKEVNLFGEDALTCAKRLNIKSESPLFNVKLLLDGEPTKLKFLQVEINLADLYNAQTRSQLEITGENGPVLEVPLTKSYTLEAKERAFRSLAYVLDAYKEENEEEPQDLSETGKEGLLETLSKNQPPARKRRRRLSSDQVHKHWTSITSEDTSQTITTQETIYQFKPEKITLKEFKKIVFQWLSTEAASGGLYIDDIKQELSSEDRLRQLHYLYEQDVNPRLWSYILLLENGEANLPTSFYKDVMDTYLYLEYSLENVQTTNNQATRLVYPTNPEIAFEFTPVKRKKPIF